MQKKAKKWLWLAIRMVVIWPLVLYVLLVMSFVAFRESLVYPGVQMFGHLSLEDPAYLEAVQGEGWELWTDETGAYCGLKRETPGARSRWVLFHGNGDVALRATNWAAFIGEILGAEPADFYVLEYPGYGPRQGKPGEQAMVDAARSALAGLPAPSAKGIPEFWFGQSMGAGVVCRLLVEPGGWVDRPKGLVLLNPYSSLIDAGRQFIRRLAGPLHRFFPVETILGDRYESERHIGAYRGPVLIVAGSDDTLTPPWMAERLAQRAGGAVDLWIQPGVGHWVNAAPLSRWREAVSRLRGGSVGLQERLGD